jgi:hypothetical protein
MGNRDYYIKASGAPSPYLPAWHHDPASPRQKKVLSFFGVLFPVNLTKGAASTAITQLMRDPEKERLWQAYVLVTGDQEQSEELLPHDLEMLKNFELPASNPRIPRKKRPQAEEILNILRQGSPFDDPLPQISIKGNMFCFTGEFDFGSRAACENVVEERGGFVGQMTRETDVLVVGNMPTPTWKAPTFGQKIETAVCYKQMYGYPHIITETYWTTLLDPDAPVYAPLEERVPKRTDR